MAGAIQRWVAMALAALALLVFAFAALAWIAGRESVLQWAAEQAVRASAGRLALAGIEGSIYGPIKAERITVEAPDWRAEGDALELDWSPSALLRGEVAIGYVRARTLRIAWKGSAQRLDLPADIELPLALSLGRADFGELTLSSDSRSDRLGDIAFGARFDSSTYRLSLTRVTSAWGEARADLSLAARPPFALSGRADLAQPAGDWPYEAAVGLSGTLAQARLEATARVRSVPLRIDASITPFAPAWIKDAVLRAQAINPAALANGLPQAEIDASIQARALPKGRFEGSLAFDNRLAGTIDKRGMRLRKLAAAFSGPARELNLEDIRADLGDAGNFSGAGSLRGGRLELVLKTANFNLRGIDSSLRATRLEGTFALGLREQVQTLQADLREPRFRLQVDAALDQARLTLRSARASAGGGELALRGEMRREAPRRFKASGTFARVDPAQFGDYFAGHVNGSFNAHGALLPAPSAALEIEIRDSRLRNYPLAAKAKAIVSPARVSEAQVDLMAAGNRLEVRGDYGSPGDRLEWILDAPRLDRLARELSGTLAGKGVLQGSIRAPAARFTLSGANVRLPGGHRIAAFSASGSLAEGLDGALEISASLKGYESAALKVAQLRAQAQGTLQAHVLSVEAKEQREIGLDAELRGGWYQASGWSGTLQRLEVRGPYPASLQRPAVLAAGKDSFSLQQLQLQLGDARLLIDEMSKSGSRISSRGEMAGFSPDYLKALRALPAGMRSTLRLGARWDIRGDLAAEASLNGDVRLWRETGDVLFEANRTIALGLTRLDLVASAQASRLTASLDIAGSTLGRARGEAKATLGGPGPPLGLNPDAPIEAVVNGDMSSLAWIGLLSQQPIDVDGALHFRVSAAGTPGSPRFAGELNGSGLKLGIVEQGVAFDHGTFTAELEGTDLRLKSFSFSGGAGRLVATGTLSLAESEPALALDWSAGKLAAIRRPDRLLVVSGAGSARLEGKRLRLTGKLVADQGLIVLPETPDVTVSEDVIVMGRPPAPKSAAPLLVQLDLGVGLGERFFVKGRGLDARLAGSLQIIADADRLPRATGTISVAQGAYSAYGQRLVIERGVVRFIGPIDNPGLDILALRKGQSVEAGVEIGGTALAPQVKLVSNPSVPDTEKVSWLVLGHGSDGASKTELELMQAAAGALLARGESVSLQAKIAQSAGLDEFAFRGAGGLQNSVVSLGKRLSKDLYVIYQHGLFTAADAVKLRYTLSPRWSLQTQAGSDTGVDLIFNVFFD